MTRETKIGLLVGLAFIIVIGILLSDHLTTATQPTRVPLTGTVTNVLDSINAPGSRRSKEVEPEHIVIPNSIERGPGKTDVEVVGGSRREAKPKSVEIVEVPGNGGRVEPNIPNGGTEAETPKGDQIAPPGTRAYVADVGDTVSRMATRFYGSNTKANRDAIIKVNSLLQANPNKVVVGETYYIPIAAGAIPAPAPVAEKTPAPPAGRSGGEVAYTTKPGDSLWKIAVQQCGSGSATMVEQIMAMNKDQFPNGRDVVRPNMKLKLPAKTALSANN
jgi:nucleoid-associated protein YgaU